MSIYEDILKTMYDKHKGHNLSKEYKVEGYLDFKISLYIDILIKPFLHLMNLLSLIQNHFQDLDLF